MTRDELMGYVGGYVDGDGTITVVSVDNGISESLRCVVEIACKHESPLRYFQGLLGGGEVRPNGDGTLKLTFMYAEAAKVAERIGDYLYLKRRQAKLLVRLNELIRNRGFRRSDGMPKEMRSQRSSVRDEISNLNNHPNPFPEYAPRGKRRSFAYLAGILDSEGSLMIQKKGNEYSPRVSVRMKDGFVCRWLVKVFGGTFQNPTPSNDVYTWEVERRVAVSCLAKALPYIRTKHEQAEILIRLQRHKDLWRSRCSGRLLPESVLRKRAAWKDRIHILNHRAGAETNPTQPTSASDSPTCQDGKLAEPLQAAAA